MKAYIKPTITETLVELQPLMDGNSVTKVTGLDGVGKGNGDFTGGAADTRRGSVWGDEEEDI